MTFQLGQVVTFEGERARIILLGDDYATIQFIGGRRDTVSIAALRKGCNCGKRR